MKIGSGISKLVGNVKNFFRFKKRETDKFNQPATVEDKENIGISTRGNYTRQGMPWWKRVYKTSKRPEVNNRHIVKCFGTFSPIRKINIGR